MARKSIYEFDAKRLVSSQIVKYYPEFNYDGKLALITPDVDLEDLANKNPWLKTERLVCKPDQLFGKRGKANLILLDADFNQLKDFVKEKLNKEMEIHGKTGKITRLLVEPFVPHEKEYYVSLTSEDDGNMLHFSVEGGIFVEENWDKVLHIPIPLDVNIKNFDLTGKLPDLGDNTEPVIHFIKGLFRIFEDQDFVFLEINPFAITKDHKIVPLDLKARLDNTAFFEHPDTWGNQNEGIVFPSGFGNKYYPEEQLIEELDEKTGASLKLKILNPDGHIWTMVSGGGASVIFTDTIVDLGLGNELSNYGEYSGNPSTEHTQIYAETIIDLMTRKPDPDGKPKILIIGGGIANFTDVKATFTGIVHAFRTKAEQMKKANVKIFVRRGGPNEKEGLKLIKSVADELGLPIDVHDRYTPMTRIVPLAIQELKGGK